MRSKYSNRLMIALAVFLAGGCAAEKSAFRIRFGRAQIQFADGGQPYQILAEETTVVARDLSNRSGLGFAVDPPNGDLYEIYSVHRLPKIPASFKSTAEIFLTADGRLQTKTDSVSGPRMCSYGFDPDDPIGTYEIEVFVNGRLAGQASISVVNGE